LETPTLKGNGYEKFNHVYIEGDYILSMLAVLTVLRTRQLSTILAKKTR